MARRPRLLRARSLGGHDPGRRLLRQRRPLDRRDAAAGVLLTIRAADHRSARTGVRRAASGLLRSGPTTTGLLRLSRPLGRRAAATAGLLRDGPATTGLL